MNRPHPMARGERLGWEQHLSASPGRTTPAVVADDPIWRTGANEEAGPGDLVALSLVYHADAVGRIIGRAGDDLVECELIRGRRVTVGKKVQVAADQLLVRVYE